MNGENELDEAYPEQEYAEAWNAFQTLMQGISDSEDGHIAIKKLTAAPKRLHRKMEETEKRNDRIRKNR